MVTHHRLENALARAEELIAVGNQSVALQLLHDAIVSRWFQHNLLALDAIMLKFVELCVELRRGRLAKDGLHQYRNLSQTVNVAGLEAVISHFLGCAEAKLEAACKEAADAASLDSVEDLEQAPEEALASVWGTSAGGASEETADRTGRALVTPWLRFVWEAFRIILDICRHNAKLEGLYRNIVERAFAFCRKYGRKAEFRRLCEILRHHLTIIVKYPGQANGVQLQDASSHSIQLELRFKQLDVATDMELWHEAFKSIEDIHGLFVLARKSAQPSLVITYYSRLCRVFQMANRHLYLAATLCKLFALSKGHSNAVAKNSAPSAKADMAPMAVLALLATPRVQERDVTCTMTAEEMEAKNTRLAMFLGLQKAPTRQSIIRELHARSILSQASTEIQQLFTILESSSSSKTDIAESRSTVEQLLTQVKSNDRYASLVPAIYKNYVAQVFEQVSRRQKEISFSSLTAMISMPTCCDSTFKLDSFILEGCRSGDFHLRVDHHQQSGGSGGMIKFEKPCFAPTPTLSINDVEKNKLVELYRLLQAFQSTTNSNIDAADEMIKEAYCQLQVEHQHNLSRRGKIEKRKEQLEELQSRKEKEEARERALKLQSEKEAERVRMAEETARREQQRREQEKEAIRREQAVKREEEEERKKEAIARRANLEKMIAVVRRLDHLERAYRQEEIPLLKSDYEKQKQADRIAYEERVALISERSKAQHAAEVQLKGRLAAMSDDYSTYQVKAAERRAAALLVQQKQMKAELERAKKAYREQLLAKAAAAREEEERCQLAKMQEDEDRAAAEAVEAAVEKKDAYIPPSKRNAQPTAAAVETGRPSPFGSKSTAFGEGGATTSGGSWRRQ